MGYTINVNVPDITEVNKKLDLLLRADIKIIALLQESAKKENHMTKELDELQAAVEENTTVDQSIMTLVDGLAAQILALKDDPAKLAALAASLKASSAAVVAKVLANTPEAPPPEV